MRLVFPWIPWRYGIGARPHDQEKDGESRGHCLSHAACDLFAKALQIRERLAAAEPDRADYQRDLSVSFEKLGDLQQAMGDGEAARDLFARALQISERLAAAEPGRADFQFDLVPSLARIASVTPESAPANLRRCLGILRALAAENRLTPDQEKWIARFEAQLAELDKA